jgi:hypothetical protein
MCGSKQAALPAKRGWRETAGQLKCDKTNGENRSSTTTMTTMTKRKKRKKRDKGKPCGAVFICNNPSSKKLNDIKSEIGWRHIGPEW